MSDNNRVDPILLEKIELERKLKLLESHMKALIGSTVDDKVQIVPGKEEWVFDPNNNTIKYATKGPVSILSLTEWEVMSVLFHEIAHAKYTEGLDLSDISIPEPKKEYAAFLNVFEDIRIERSLGNRFPGTEDNFQTIANKQQELINEELYNKLPPHLNLLLNLRQKERGFNYKFKDADTERTFYALEEKFEEAYSQKSSTALHEFLSTQVWDQFAQLIPPPPPPGPGKGEGSGGEGEGEESESGSAGSGPGEGTPPPPKPESEKEKEEEPKTEDEEGKEPPEPKEELPPEFNDDEFQKEIGEAQEIGDLLNAMIKHSGKEAESKGESLIDQLDDSKKDPSQEQMEAKSLIKDDEIERYMHKGNYKTYEELFEDIRPYYNFFRQKLNSIMEDNRLARHGGSYLSGTLDNQNLYKWKCKNYRVFGKPVMRQNRDYAVTLLVDESGSMNDGVKNVNAARGAVLLSEVLNAIGIPFEIRGFNDSTRIYKGFNMPFDWNVKRTMEAIIPSTNTNDAGYNNDGYAVNWSMTELKKQKGQKILIVLSDGQPAPSTSYIPAECKKRLKKRKEFNRYSDFDLRDEIRLAKRDALVIGVGIKAHHVGDYYPESALCDEISQLPKVVLNILRKHIKRG